MTHVYANVLDPVTSKQASKIAIATKQATNEPNNKHKHMPGSCFFHRRAWHRLFRTTSRTRRCGRSRSSPRTPTSLQSSCRSEVQILGPPARCPISHHALFGWEGSPTKIDYMIKSWYPCSILSTGGLRPFCESWAVLCARSALVSGTVYRLEVSCCRMSGRCCLNGSRRLAGASPYAHMGINIRPSKRRL